MAMRWIVGYLFDGWNTLRFAAQEIGKAIDRAMDVFGDDDWPDRDTVLA